MELTNVLQMSGMLAVYSLLRRCIEKMVMLRLSRMMSVGRSTSGEILHTHILDCICSTI